MTKAQLILQVENCYKVIDQQKREIDYLKKINDIYTSMAKGPQTMPIAMEKIIEALTQTLVTITQYNTKMKGSMPF